MAVDNPFTLQELEQFNLDQLKRIARYLEISFPKKVKKEKLVSIIFETTYRKIDTDIVSDRDLMEYLKNLKGVVQTETGQWWVNGVAGYTEPKQISARVALNIRNNYL